MTETCKAALQDLRGKLVFLKILRDSHIGSDRLPRDLRTPDCTVA